MNHKRLCAIWLTTEFGTVTLFDFSSTVWRQEIEPFGDGFGLEDG